MLLFACLALLAPAASWAERPTGPPAVCLADRVWVLDVQSVESWPTATLETAAGACTFRVARLFTSGCVAMISCGAPAVGAVRRPAQRRDKGRAAVDLAPTPWPFDHNAIAIITSTGLRFAHDVPTTELEFVQASARCPWAGPNHETPASCSVEPEPWRRRPSALRFAGRPATGRLHEFAEEIPPPCPTRAWVAGYKTHDREWTDLVRGPRSVGSMAVCFDPTAGLLWAFSFSGVVGWDGDVELFMSEMAIRQLP